MAQFYNALKCIGDLWAKNHKWITNSGDETEDSLENINLEQLGTILSVKASVIKRRTVLLETNKFIVLKVDLCKQSSIT